MDMTKKKKRIRLTPNRRKAIIEEAAVKVAHEKGLARVNCDTVAAACEITTHRSTVKYHYASKDDLVQLILQSEYELSDQILIDAESMGFEVA